MTHLSNLSISQQTGPAGISRRGQRRVFSHLLLSVIGVALFVIAIPQPAKAYQTCFDGGLLVDYGDPGYTENGAWEDVTGSYQTAGQSWTDVRRTGQDGAWAQWKVRIPTSGKYRVYFWHISSVGGKIEVTHNGQTDTIKRNMEVGHLGWSSLGDYDFAAGSETSVKISHTLGQLLVDSVKFIAVDKIKPLIPLPPYPKPDGSFPHIDEKGNMVISGQPYQILYQNPLSETIAHPESVPFYDEIFDIALAQGVNTLGANIFWRDFETAKDVYEYRNIDALIEKARARHMHLSLLLPFGWATLQSGAVPDYINHDHATYLNLKNPDGSDANGYQVSPFAAATREAEARALKALFQRILEKDPDHQIVITVQLENEMPSNRDYSVPAMEAWKGQVPKELIDYLGANEGSINRLIWSAWFNHGRKASGTWSEVFGDSTDANSNRIFGIWSFAHYYIEPLVKDIKTVLPIPIYMNAWQHESPSSYSYMDVFHAGAPSLDAMGPDAYGDMDKWEEDVGLSARPWHRMVIPEQHHTANAFWRGIANYNTLICGQFYDVEGSDWLCCRETYDLINAMSPIIASKRGTGDMTGFFQSRHGQGESWSEYFQDLKITYTATVRPHTFAQFVKEVSAPCEKISNVALGELDGCGLLISLGNGEYLITSTRIDVALSYINGGAIRVSDAQQGHFENGNWISEGTARVGQEGESIRFHFPTENRHYGQIRFKLTSTAGNPAKVYEAERSTLLKDAEPFYNYGASGAFGVMSLRREGAGIQIKTDAGFDAGALTVRYACDGPSKAMVFLNGTSQNIDFPVTGSTTNWAEISIPLSIPRGTTLSIQAKKDTPAPNLDCIMLSRNVPADLTIKSAGSP